MRKTYTSNKLTKFQTKLKKTKIALNKIKNNIKSETKKSLKSRFPFHLTNSASNNLIIMLTKSKRKKTRTNINKIVDNIEKMYNNSKENLHTLIFKRI